MDREENKYLYWMFAAPGIGSKSGMDLIARLGSPREVYHRRERTVEFIRTGSRKEYAQYIREKTPEEVYEVLLRSGAQFTALPLSDYPEKLRHIPDPPFGLTWLGSLPDPDIPAVAVIGARQCSDYGRRMAEQFGRDLAVGGAQVISGMAVGIDGLAQRAAISAGGRSYAILGSGVDICYPKENRDLYEHLPGRGGIISEQPVGMKPLPKHFPMRNRLISGFCDALLVIEARRRSGTLITVEMALDQGRDIFAIPGRITDALSDGCHQLIREGASIATCSGDVLGTLFPEKIRKKKAGERSSGAEDDALSEEPAEAASDAEQNILAILADHAVSVAVLADELSQRGTCPGIPELMEMLLRLCASGILCQEGGYFRLR